MTLLAPTALYVLLAGAGVVLVYFLRTRSRRQDVSDLFLWDGLPSEPRTRAARIRRRLDPLLLLQLLVVCLVVLALAGPAVRVARPHLAGMAIVLDGSASMRARSRDGVARYDLARQAALDLVRRYPAAPVAVLQLSRVPTVLASLSPDHAAALRAISSSSPGPFSDGSAADLSILLESQGGPGRFDRIFWLGDRSLGEAVPNLEETLYPPAENVAVTAFRVRANPDGAGSTAFARLANLSASYCEGTLRVSDGVRAAVLSFVLAPRDEEAYVLVLPGSLGPAFSASLDTKDGFPDDDVRYATLPAPAARRIRWLGNQNRYLMAALEVTGDAAWLAPEDPSPADLVVACDTSLPASAAGSILLVHSGLAGLIEVGEDGPAGDLAVGLADDPLLAQVDPADFAIRASPDVRLAQDVRTILSVGSRPLLCRYTDAARRVVFLAPDLLQTNLPLTVDFPLLVGNALRWLLSFGREAPAAVTLGEPVVLSDYGRVTGLRGPRGESIALPAGSEGFVPSEPGLYAVATDRAVFLVAANLDPAESAPAPDPGATAASTSAAPTRRSSLFDLWPFLAGLGLLALGTEAFLYRGLGWRRRP